MDGRWLAEATDRAGGMACGGTREEAIRTTKAFALRVMADCLEQIPGPTNIFAGPACASGRSREGRDRTAHADADSSPDRIAP